MSATHAHLILPPTGPLEREHCDVALNGVAVRSVAKYAPAMLEAPPDARHDWQIRNQGETPSG